MEWKHCALIWRVKSPIHVGLRRSGNLMQTRPYIPWRVWGAAFTRVLTERLPSGSGVPYQDVGKLLEQNFRFGYAWPAVLKDGKSGKAVEDYEVLFNEWVNNRELFEYRLLDAREGTARDALAHTAEEGTLHHVEFLMPNTRDTGEPVFLALDLWVREPMELSGTPEPVQNLLKGWEEHTRFLQIGGERTYGWGRVERCLCFEGHRETLVGRLTWVEEKGEIRVRINKNKRIPFHVFSTQDQNFVGPVEVLAGYRNTGKTFLIPSPPVMYAPGAVVMEPCEVIPDPGVGFRSLNNRIL